MQRNMVRDTVLLTVIQMLLDGLALLLNVFLNAQLGAEAIGILTLTASLYRLASVTASGNVFLCASRFVSEELGKRERNPGMVLRYCLIVSLVLSAAVSGCMVLFAPWCSSYFLEDPSLAILIRLMAISLPLLSVSACMKGWFNACCHAGICAAADLTEFLIRTGCMAAIVLLFHPKTAKGLGEMTVISTAIASGAELLLLLILMPKRRQGKTGRVSIRLKTYIKLAIPVMTGSMLTSFLSAANDALVPVTLRQAGNSAAEAFSQFGIFEAIILPTLFFPSTVLCSLAGILVTETARANAARQTDHICSLTDKTLRQTIVYAVFITMYLMLFGDEIGELLGGGVTAGRMIAFLAPVVPFIYLEIVLESIIKGLGAQAFSSINYLCEYIIRISIVLVCIPLMGFPGIVLSYYASNICGNLARIIVVLRRTGLRPEPVKLLGIPLFSAVFAAQTGSLLFTLLGADPGAGIPSMVLFGLLSGCVYLGCQRYLFRMYGAIPHGEPLLPTFHGDS